MKTLLMFAHILGALNMFFLILFITYGSWVGIIISTIGVKYTLDFIKTIKRRIKK